VVEHFLKVDAAGQEPSLLARDVAPVLGHVKAAALWKESARQPKQLNLWAFRVIF
jgi:hypothetical protein